MKIIDRLHCPDDYDCRDCTSYRSINDKTGGIYANCKFYFQTSYTYYIYKEKAFWYCRRYIIVNHHQIKILCDKYESKNEDNR